MARGGPSQTVKAAKIQGDRRSGDRGAKARQEELGVRHTVQKHVCDSTCDSPCQVA